jgi:tetratricopeptide (TPR) repeat protein
MRKVFLVVLVFLVISLCSPIRAEVKNLTYPSDYYAEGNNLVDQGQYEDALAMFRTARSMDERFYNEHYGISYQIGWVLNKLGRYEEALEEFQIAEKYQPEFILPFAVYYNEGYLLAKLGRNEEALEAFDSAFTYDYTNRFISFNKGIVLARMGRYAEAVTAFDTSRKAYGSNLPQLGSYQEAAATYDRAQGISPSVADIPGQALPTKGSPQSVASDAYDTEWNTDLLMRTGMDFVARYQYENALVVFDRILKIDSVHYRAMDWKAYSLANLGRYEEAEKMFDHTLLYLDYKRHEAFYIDAYTGKGWVLAKQGKFNESINAYDKALVVDSDLFWAHYNKGWVLAQQGKYEEAAKEYDRSLELERQIRIRNPVTRSHTILGPLGTYRDAANAYDKTKSTQSFLTELSAQPSYDVVIYQTDFSTDPGWRTSATRLYSWDPVNKSYRFKSDPSPGFAETEIPYNGEPFQLEYDITIPHADPGALVRFGLAQHNTSENEQNVMVRYNSENLVMGEFKSWRAGTYRNAKDGDKTVEVYAIDDRKYAFDTEYEGWCRINREESITIPSFGENRIYHVVIVSEPEKETISIKVTDNLHEKTYYVCSRKWAETGRFSGMNRLILVAEPAENAFIEGSIDNIVLSVPSVQTPASVPVGTIHAPRDTPLVTPAVLHTATQVTKSDNISPSPPSPGDGTELINPLPSIFTSPAALVPVILLIIVVIALFIAADYLNKRKMK